MLAELKERLGSNTTEFNIGPEVLQAPDISSLWEEFFASDTLNVRFGSLTDRVSSRGYLMVSGEIALLGVDSNIRMAFFTISDPEELGCLIVIDPKDSWEVSQSFPELPSYINLSADDQAPKASFLGDFDLQNFRMLFSSHDSADGAIIASVLDSIPSSTNEIKAKKEQVRQGLNFYARPALSGALTFLNPLLDGFNLQLLYGYLQEVDGLQSIHFFVPITAALEVSSFKAAFKGFEFYSSTTDHLFAESGIRVFGEIEAGSILVEMYAEIPVGGSSMTINALLPDGLSIAQLADLTPLTNQPNLEQELPDALGVLTGISLQSISSVIEISNPGVSSLNFEFLLANQLDFIPGLIQLEQMHFFGQIDQPFASNAADRQMELALTADWKITDARILTSATLPQLTLYGELAPEDDLNLVAVFNKFFPELAFDDEIWLLDLEVSAAQSGDFSVFAELAQLWEIDFEITTVALNQLAVTIARQGGHATSGLVNGVFNIGGIDLFLSAEVPGGDAGWHFSGASGADQQIPVGQLIGALADQFGVGDEMPEALTDFTIENVFTSFNTADKHFIFSCEGNLDIDGKAVQLLLDIDLIREGTGDTVSYKKEFSGEIVIAEQRFLLFFSAAADSRQILAVYSSEEGEGVSLGDLVGALSDDVGDAIASISLSLNQVLFSFSKDNSTDTSKYVFGVSIDTGMDFTNLPLVGSSLPPEAQIAVDGLSLLYAKGAWTAAEFEDLNAIDTEIPLEFPALDLNGGGNVQGNIQFGTFPLPFAFAFGGQSTSSSSSSSAGASASDGNTSTTAAATTSPAPLPAPTSPGKWFSVNKQLGPLNVARVGVNFADGKLWFMADAEVTLGPLTLLLEDLSFGSPLDRFDPSFNLRGFGLSYVKGPVEVSGLFLRANNQGSTGDSNLPEVGDRFAGAALIKTSQLTIAAIGEYAKVSGEPSFYLYAYLGYPIGGPAFFFVEGLAAGFGYNRSVRIPPIQQVASHPMVSIATEGTSDLLTLADALINGNYIPIDLGKIFLAVGVRFTTFKLLDSFALIVATFGESFRLDILGRSKLVVPTPIPGGKVVDPLAEVTLLLSGSFIPSEGFLGIQAELSNDSYVLSKDCVLTGGFAFFTWFDPSPHSGDFVLTLGGYHPRFRPPAHYPRVPRLGFNWQISSALSIKGGLYFALTPSMVMAGGSLKATWEDGSIEASFTIGADFLISWKPYRYEAEIYVNLSVSYTFWFFGEQTISFDIGADLQVWGPEFAGIARIDLDIVSFEVEFGDQNNPGAQPISWSTFESSFLPKAKDRLSIAAKAGLIGTTEDETNREEIWIINPKRFKLTTDSVVPIKTSNRGESSTQSFGISTMNKGSVDSHLEIRIENNAGDSQDILFSYRKQEKSIPWAMWGTAMKKDKNPNGEPQMIHDVMTGFEVVPKPPTEQPDEMSWMQKELLKFNVENGQNELFKWEGVAAYESGGSVTEIPVSDVLGAFGFNSTEHLALDKEQLDAELDLSGSAKVLHY